MMKRLLVLLVIPLAVACRSLPLESQLVTLASGEGRYNVTIVDYDKKTRVARVRRQLATAVSGNNVGAAARNYKGLGKEKRPELEAPLEYYRFDGTTWKSYIPSLTK